MATVALTTGAGTSAAWLISPLADSVFIIGTPLLIVLLYFPLQALIPPAILAAFVVQVLPLSHHLPGFLRAYGDPSFFRVFRWRLLLAPPLIFAGLFWFTTNHAQGAKLYLAMWAHWHGFMQVYGFLRVYAVKSGQTAPRGATLDWALCAAWFLAALLASIERSRELRAAANAGGVWFLERLFAADVVGVAWLVTGAITVAYVGHALWSHRHGEPLVPAKLLLVASSCSFLYFCWVHLGAFGLLGVAAYELFHDVQYFAIVWASNRKLADRADLTPMVSKLFQPGASLAMAYVGIALAYAGVLAGGAYVSLETPSKPFFFALIGTSAAVHFYLDGFMWKVRQPRVRSNLGIDAPLPAMASGISPASANAAISLREELPQIALLIAPFLLLALLPWR